MKRLFCLLLLFLLLLPSFAFAKESAQPCYWLLTDVLRKDWGFAGLVVTDWGALCDRVKAMHAGCDLSMPGGSTYMEDWVRWRKRTSLT